MAKGWEWRVRGHLKTLVWISVGRNVKRNLLIERFRGLLTGVTPIPVTKPFTCFFMVGLYYSRLPLIKISKGKPYPNRFLPLRGGKLLIHVEPQEEFSDSIFIPRISYSQVSDHTRWEGGDRSDLRCPQGVSTCRIHGPSTTRRMTDETTSPRYRSLSVSILRRSGRSGTRVGLFWDPYGLRRDYVFRRRMRRI